MEFHRAIFIGLRFGGFFNRLFFRVSWGWECSFDCSQDYDPDSYWDYNEIDIDSDHSVDFDNLIGVDDDNLADGPAVIGSFGVGRSFVIVICVKSPSRGFVVDGTLADDVDLVACFDEDCFGEVGFDFACI